MEILNENDDVVINFDKLTPKTDFLLSEFDRIPGSDFLYKTLIFVAFLSAHRTNLLNVHLNQTLFLNRL